MDHVEIAAEPIDPATDGAPLADRQVLLQPVIAGVEENEVDKAGSITAAHAIGLALVARLLVPLDLELQRDNGAILGQSQAGAVAPVDDPGRPVPKQVDDMRTT